MCPRFRFDRAFQPDIFAVQIEEIHGIGKNVFVKVRIAAAETDRVLGGPPPHACVIIARSESHELRVGIIESARESEGLEAGRGIGQNVAKFVVANHLRDGTRARIDDQTRRTEVIGDDAIGHAAANHVVGNIGPRAVHELTDHGIASVELRNDSERITIQPAPHEHAIDLLSDWAVLRIDHVLDFRTVRQSHATQIPKSIVLVSRCAGGIPFVSITYSP